MNSTGQDKMGVGWRTAEAILDQIRQKLRSRFKATIDHADRNVKVFKVPVEHRENIRYVMEELGYHVTFAESKK